MTPTTMTRHAAKATHTLDVPGATLTYDVRRSDATVEPPLVLIGTPMGAAGFETLSGHFPDRTVVTYDPRGTERSTITDAGIAATPAYVPDIEALRAAPTRIVIAVGAESEGILARRGGEAIAERLGTQAVIFPSGHSGFMGGEYGQTGEPEAFAAKLREVLAQAS